MKSQITTAIASPNAHASGDPINMREAASNQRWLVAAQALYGCCSAIGLTLSGLVGSVLAPSIGWATLPFALLTVGTALSTLGVSHAMTRYGRRPVFVMGALCGAVGGAIAAWAIVHGSFWGFCAANMLFGAFQACAQYYRFAVTEVVTTSQRARALGYVTAAGLVAAVVGPSLATWVKDALAPHTFAGSYLAVLALALVSMAVLGRLQLAIPVAQRRALSFLGVRRVLGLPGYGVASLSAATGYAVMIFVMTATPLAVVGCGLSVGAAGSVIQWHLVSMFAPGFFSGGWIARFGSTRVIQAGIALFGLACAVALTDQSLPNFGIALVLNGVAWHLMYVGATHALVVALDNQSAENKALGQSISEFLTFSMVAAGSLLAGAVFNGWGWGSINITVLAVLALAAVFALGGLIRRVA